VKGSTTLQMGYVARAHGLNGELGVRTFDPQSEALFEAENVRLKLKDGSEVDFVVDSVRNANKELLLGLEGIDSRNAAEPLVGSTIFVFRDELEPPAEGEFFQGDLVGLSAVTDKGEPLGVVEEIWNTGPIPNLVIRAAGRPEIVVPFVDEFVPHVDLSEGRIVVHPPDLDE
jgi:16S rRNA processing protein RimM